MAVMSANHAVLPILIVMEFIAEDLQGFTDSYISENTDIKAAEST
jgi:hypothetical protein